MKRITPLFFLLIGLTFLDWSCRENHGGCGDDDGETFPARVIASSIETFTNSTGSIDGGDTIEIKDLSIIYELSSERIASIMNGFGTGAYATPPCMGVFHEYMVDSFSISLLEPDTLIQFIFDGLLFDPDNQNFGNVGFSGLFNQDHMNQPQSQRQYLIEFKVKSERDIVKAIRVRIDLFNDLGEQFTELTEPIYVKL